jgi:hypothetical protein
MDFTSTSPVTYDNHIFSLYSISIKSFFPHTTMISNNHFRMATFAFIIITFIYLVSHVGRQKKINNIILTFSRR